MLQFSSTSTAFVFIHNDSFSRTRFGGLLSKKKVSFILQHKLVVPLSLLFFEFRIKAFDERWKVEQCRITHNASLQQQSLYMEDTSFSLLVWKGKKRKTFIKGSRENASRRRRELALGRWKDGAISQCIWRKEEEKEIKIFFWGELDRSLLCETWFSKPCDFSHG